MLFNSYVFIFLFLPVTLIIWYALNRKELYKTALGFLSIASFIFYGYFNLSYSLILISSILINYGISALLKKNNSKAFLIIGITFNLGLLFYFKYYDFFVSNINSIFGTDINLKNIILPLGISFFTFQQISFIVDRYKSNAPHYNFVEYCAFVTFFPQLVAGPIVLHSELITQFRDINKRKFNSDNFGQGICYFVLGLSKKLLIADMLAGPVNFAFSNIAMLDTPSSIVAALAYTMELLFDFSGYSDMAIGLGKMFGLELPVNFNAPMRSASVKEFWRRWHITLGRFFTTYVYIPLGGNRKGLARLLLNTMIVFALSGLWHGANYTFIVWGLMHGICICINNIWSRKLRQHIPFFKTNKLLGIRKIISIIITFIYVNAAFVFFRCDSLSDAGLFFKRLFSGDSYKFIFQLGTKLNFYEGYVIQKYLEMNTRGYEAYYLTFVFALIMFIALILAFGKPLSERIKKRKMGTLYALLISFLFVWCVISLGSVSTFLYFNF